MFHPDIRHYYGVYVITIQRILSSSSSSIIKLLLLFYYVSFVNTIPSQLSLSNCINHDDVYLGRIVDVYVYLCSPILTYRIPAYSDKLYNSLGTGSSGKMTGNHKNQSDVWSDEYHFIGWQKSEMEKNPFFPRYINSIVTDFRDETSFGPYNSNYDFQQFLHARQSCIGFDNFQDFFNPEYPADATLRCTLHKPNTYNKKNFVSFAIHRFVDLNVT